MRIREKIRGIETMLIGNRFSALGNALLIGGAVSIYIEGIESAGIFSRLALATGMSLSSYTGFGISIEKTYRRSSDHIKKFGKLDQRFFDKMVGSDKFYNLTGYCQLQGMYLACRDNNPDLLPEFAKLKAQRTKNIIPNI